MAQQRAVREAVSGLRIGDLVLEPQDVEVDDKVGWLWCGVVWCGVVWCGVVW